MNLYSFKRTPQMAILLLFLLCMAGCAKISGDGQNIIESTSQSSVITTKERKTSETVVTWSEAQKLPASSMPQWREGDTEYDVEDTIYYKTYYEYFVRGKQMDMKFPDIKLQENFEDYFTMEEFAMDETDKVVALFFDNRTIGMDERILKDFIRPYGYEIYFHSEIIDELNIRFVEIKEIEGLSLYPSRILIQTWDKEHLYLQDITGPIPKKIRSFLTLTDRESPQLILHSSSLSVDYISEEELSFWTFRGSYWVLTTMDLSIDAGYAHSAGTTMYPDINRDTLFEPVYYRDGIVYRPSIQDDGLHPFTYRLGKLEEIEKNKSFKLIGISEAEGKTIEAIDCYIKFEVN